MTQHFWAYTQIVNLLHEGSTILMQCYLGICRGTFLATKSHLLRICAINNFLVIGEDVKFCEIFFDGLLHVPCLGCEVKNDMSGQSNNCLKVCNVKMKKKLPRQKHPTFPWTFFDGPLQVSCLGWEVNAHVRGQSNDCLRVCNAKMKKILLGQKWGTFPCMYGLQGPSI